MLGHEGLAERVELVLERRVLLVAEGLVGECPDGVGLVELAARTDPTLVVQAVAEVFGLKEGPGRTIDQVLLDYMREKDLLLVWMVSPG